MGKKGQSNFIGLNYQAKAALALLLQHLNMSGFAAIQLESPKLQDFDIVFSSGQKIVCEAKAWTSKSFGPNDLLRLFDDLAGRSSSLEDGDTFLVVTCKATDSLKKLLQRVRSGGIRFADQILQNSPFTKNHFPFLQKVELWIISERETEDICFSLIAEQLRCWIDPDSLKKIVDTVLVEKIYSGSAKGKILKREELLSWVDFEKNEIREGVGADLYPPNVRLQLIQKAAQNSLDPLWARKNLSALSGNIGEVLFAIKELSKQTDLELSNWETVFYAIASLPVCNSIFTIIKSNLRSQSNLEFALKFLKNQSKNSNRSLQFGYHGVELVSLCAVIFEKDPSSINHILEAVDQVLAKMNVSKFYRPRTNSNQYLIRVVGQLLHEIFEKGSPEIKTKVAKFIFRSFLLIEDDGEYWEEASPQIYQVLRNYILIHTELVEVRFLDVCNSISTQFSASYKQLFGKEFAGFELIGGMSSWHGDEYEIQDRFFIREILSPVLLAYGALDLKGAFEIIKSNCVYLDSQVSFRKPDFLRRASIPFLMEVYSKGPVELDSQAETILMEFIRSENGTPPMHELIFQMLDEGTPYDKAWPLLSAALSLRKATLNPFIERHVCRFASLGFREAISIVSLWLDDPKCWSASIIDQGPFKLVNSLRLSQPAKALSSALKIIEGEYFTGPDRHFNVYQWAELLAQLFCQFSTEIKEVLRTLSKRDTLSECQQVLYVETILKIIEGKFLSATQKIEFYQDILRPFLSNNSHVGLISIGHIREQLAEFSARLVINGSDMELVESAVEVLEYLSNDPLPPSQFDSERCLGDGDSHILASGSVRGRVAKVLGIFISPVGRPILARIFDLLNRLLEDENLNVRNRACDSFGLLLQRRLSLFDENCCLPFLSDDSEQANHLVLILEQKALDLISANLICSGAPNLHFTNLFHQFKVVDFKTAQSLWLIAERAGAQVCAQILNELIFYAHFRGQALLPNQMHERLRKEEFDCQYFKNILESLCLHSDEALRASLSRSIKQISNLEIHPDRIRNIPISLHYFEFLWKRFHSEVYSHIHLFIFEHLKECFSDCFALWLNLVKTELSTIESLSQTAKIGLSLCCTSEILEEAARRNECLFLEGLELLLCYPRDVEVFLDAKVSSTLAKIREPRERILHIFDKWILRDPLKYSDREDWLKMSGLQK